MVVPHALEADCITFGGMMRVHFPGTSERKTLSFAAVSGVATPSVKYDGLVQPPRRATESVVIPLDAVSPASI